MTNVIKILGKLKKTRCFEYDKEKKTIFKTSIKAILLEILTLISLISIKKRKK